MQDGLPWQLEDQSNWETQGAVINWAYATVATTTWGCEDVCSGLLAEDGFQLLTETGEPLLTEAA